MSAVRVLFFVVALSPPVVVAQEQAPKPDDKGEFVEAHRQAARKGDVAVSIALARVGLVPVKDIGGALTSSKKECLQLLVLIKNHSDTRKVDYKSWSADRQPVAAVDHFGNNYLMAGFGLGMVPQFLVGKEDLPGLDQGVVVPQLKAESIHPGKQAFDVLLYEAPVPKADHVLIELPCANFGGEGVVRFKVVRGLWDGSVTQERQLRKEKADAEARQLAAGKAKAEAAERAGKEAERKVAEAVKRAEAAAEAKVALARQYIDLGKKDLAKKKLEEVVRDHPATKAAEDARALLKKL